MKKYMMITPEGTKDFLFEECNVFDGICDKIQKIFEDFGYRKVITPGVEFFDLFSADGWGIPQEDMFKAADSKGRILVMRPDSTLPIARMAATRLKNHRLPIRLYYRQAIYQNKPSLMGKSCEVLQMGVELLGAVGKCADLDIITAAIESLSSVFEDFRIEIGHAGLFKVLSDSLNVSEDTREDIRIAIESKNYPALNDILDGIEDSMSVRAMRSLPKLFGGIEVLEQAISMEEFSPASQELNYIMDLYRGLCDLGYSDKITIDLGLVQRNDYYSGIVFSGYVDGSGAAILSGGRYDTLLDNFSVPMGAAGFALNIDEMAQVKFKSGFFEPSTPSQVLIFAEKGYEVEAVKYARSLRKTGVRAELSAFDKEEEAVSYAKAGNIGKIIKVSKDITEIR